MDIFKPDKDFGVNISLTEDRSLPKGHKIFNLQYTDTEVDAIKKILDKYINTSTLDSACELNNHKIDFSITFLDSMIIIMTKKFEETEKYLKDVESELNDISHRIIKPTLSGNPLTKEEKIKIFDMQEELLVYRRNLKDSISIQKVFIENLEKTRNFILSMNQRMYTPKSERFQNDSEFYIKCSKNKDTRVNTTKKED